MKQPVRQPSRPLEEFMQSSADEWTRLRAEAESLFGRDSDLYGLPTSLINALRAAEIGFLTKPESDFEHKLTDFLGRHFSIGLIDEQLVRSSLFEERAPIQISPEDFDELGWQQFGITYEAANRSAAEGESRALLFHEQLVGYTGWLITNPIFIADVATMRDRERDYLAATTPEEAESFVREMNAFLCKWQLIRMVTWELPEPQGPNLSGIDGPAAARRGAAAVTLDFPSSTRLPARFPIRELMSEIRGQSGDAHLAEWYKILDQERDKPLGLQGFQRILRLRFLRDIVLGSRYGDRFKGMVEALDRAFGVYLDLSADSVKKLRLEINRRLKSEG